MWGPPSEVRILHPERFYGRAARLHVSPFCSATSALFLSVLCVKSASSSLSFNSTPSFASPLPVCCNCSVTMTDYAESQALDSFTERMDNPDTSVKAPPRPEASKTTLPQPGRPIPSRAYPGALIVVECTDGSRKSTQLYLLKRWLEIGGYRLHFTEWNSSPLAQSPTRRGKQRRLRATPNVFPAQAATFWGRTERDETSSLQLQALFVLAPAIYIPPEHN